MNGKLAKLGDRVVMSDEIKVDGRLQNQKGKNSTLPALQQACRRGMQSKR